MKSKITVECEYCEDVYTLGEEDHSRCEHSPKHLLNIISDMKKDFYVLEERLKFVEEKLGVNK